MSTKEVRQYLPYFIIGAEANVSARYLTETPIEDERVMLGFDGARLEDGNLTLKMTPETAVRLYGAIGAALKERDERKPTEEAARRCAEVGRGD